MRFIEYYYHKFLNLISIYTKFVVCLLHPRRTATEHGGERGVQLSVGAEMEAYGDQGQREDLPITNLKWHNWQGLAERT